MFNTDHHLRGDKCCHSSFMLSSASTTVHPSGLVFPAFLYEIYQFLLSSRLRLFIPSVVLSAQITGPSKFIQSEKTRL